MWNHEARRPDGGRRASCAFWRAALLVLAVACERAPAQEVATPATSDQPAAVEAKRPSEQTAGDTAAALKARTDTADVSAATAATQAGGTDATDAADAADAADATNAVDAADGDGTGEPTDVLEAALDLAARERPRQDRAAAHAALADLATRYRELVPADATPEQRARAFATVLFDDGGFRSIDDLADADALYIDTVLARRRGYCLSLSIVALALADRVGEPLHAIALPNHVLVRWDDGETHFNLELTRGGALVSDDALLEQLGPFGRTDGLYLRTLDDDEVLALMLHNRGFVALSDGRTDAARADLERAVELLPGLAEAHRNLGVLHGEAGRYDAAMRCFGKALAAHPGDADALLNLAVARAGADDLRGALDDLEIFALLAPGHPRLEPLRAEWSRRLARAEGVPALDDPPGDMRPGLQVTWFRGTDLRREVTTGIARDLDLDAGRGAPLRGLPSDGSSARWTGWFKAPANGAYQIFAVSNDGLRFELGDSMVLEHWRDVGYTSWQGAGEVHLLEGWHPLRIEWFDDSGNARLWIKIALDGREYPFDLREHLFHVVE